MTAFFIKKYVEYTENKLTLRRKRCIIKTEIKEGDDKDRQRRYQVADRLADRNNPYDLSIE